MLKGFGCLTWLALMLVAFLTGGVYFRLNQQREDWTYLYYLALPLAVLAAIINVATDKHDKAKKATEAQAEAAEHAKEHGHRMRLWDLKEQEAERYARAHGEEELTTPCYACQKRISLYASICPYCRTRSS
jgi:hypothetical protein